MYGMGQRGDSIGGKEEAGFHFGSCEYCYIRWGRYSRGRVSSFCLWKTCHK